MRDHVLLQAIARVNRPYEDDEGRRKPSGFVLDFVGLFDKLERALAFDSDDVKGVVEGIDVLKERFSALMAQAVSQYLSLAVGKTGDKAAEAVLDHFREVDRREEFYQFFGELEDVYEILSPDAFLRPFVEQYQELGRIYQLVRASYERGIPVDKAFLRKTARLVQEQTRGGGIAEPTQIYELNEGALERIAAGDKPDTVKVFNLLKVLHDMVRQHAHDQPWLIGIGDRAQAIAEAFEQRQKDTQEALAELEQLIRELREAEGRRKESDLSPEAFAVLWYLQRNGVNKPQEVAEQAAAAFEANPHWRSSSHQEQEVRKALYKALIDAGADDVVEAATGVLRMLRRASA